MTGRFRGRITAAAAAAAALFLLSCSGEGDGGETSGGGPAAKSGEGAGEQVEKVNTYKGSVSDVTFKTLTGSRKKISDFGREILIVNYLATWNEDSRKLVPIMNEVQRKFSANVIVIGVVTDAKSAAQAKAFGKTHGAKFELLLPGGSPGRFGTPGKLPTSYVVTRDNYIFTSFEGLFRANKYDELIKSMYRQRM